MSKSKTTLLVILINKHTLGVKEGGQKGQVVSVSEGGGGCGILFFLYIYEMDGSKN
jgi:hypothetical protein